MKKQQKIENLISKFLQLHDRKIDLSLDRINRLNKDLKIDFDKIKSKTITISGTNGNGQQLQQCVQFLKPLGIK